jgi:peptide/nickel transport system substrate-binding protein
LAAAAATTLALAGLTPAQAANKTDLVIGSPVEPTTWDPSGANIGHYMPYYQAAYDTLILRSPDGSYKPNLATKWKVAADAKSMTIDLRKDVKFTDGTAFNAEAAKANIDSYVKQTGPYTAKLAGTSVAVVDSDTIKLTMATPNPEIVFYLATTGSFMASPKTLGTSGLKTKPVGSGPYIFKSGTAGSQYVFEANPKYWDKSKQKFKKVVFKVLIDNTARLNALLGGQVDTANLTSATMAAAKKKNFNVQAALNDVKGLLLFDRAGAKNPALAKVEVRQALNYAFDRKALAAAVDPGAQPTNQVFNPATGGYDKKYDSYYGLNVAKAKALLKTAGYPDGFTLKLNPWLEPNLNALVEGYLKVIGVKVEFTTDTFPAWYTNAKAGKHEAIIMTVGQGTDYVTAENFLAKDGGWNCNKYTDPVITKAFASIEAKATPANIKAQAKAMNKYVVENAWNVPFYRVPIYVGTSKRIKATLQAQNAFPYLYNFAPTGK